MKKSYIPTFIWTFSLKWHSFNIVSVKSFSVESWNSHLACLWLFLYQNCFNLTTFSYWLKLPSFWQIYRCTFNSFFEIHSHESKTNNFKPKIQTKNLKPQTRYFSGLESWVLTEKSSSSQQAQVLSKLNQKSCWRKKIWYQINI